MEIIKAVLFVLLLSLFSCNSSENSKENVKDSGNGKPVFYASDNIESEEKIVKSVSTISPNNLRLVAEYEIGKNKFFKKNIEDHFEYPDDFIVENGKIYLLSYHNNSLMILDPQTGSTTSNSKINELINSCSEKYYGVNKVYVKSDKVYLKCLKAVLQYNLRTGDVVVTPQPFNIIHMSVLQDESFLTFSVDTVIHYNSNGKIISGYSFPGIISENAVNYNDSIFEKSHEKINIFALDQIRKNAAFKTEKFATNKSEGDEKYLHTITPSYYVMFDYKKRDRLFLINRFTNRLAREITFDPNLLKQESLDIPAEDEADGVRIAAEDDNNFYILLMKNNSIQVYHLRA